MKKTVVFLAVVMAMFMMPMVSSAVGIDGTISMDTELIEFDDEWHDTDEWFTGDGEPYEGDIPMYMEPITQDGGNSILDIGNMDEEKDVDITIPKYDGMVNIFGAWTNPNNTNSQNNTIVRNELGIADSDTYSIQGGCSDGTYVYFAFYISNRKTGQTVSQKIVCGMLEADGSFDVTKAKIRNFTDLGHVNALAYNEKTKKIIISVCFDEYIENNKTMKSQRRNQLVEINAEYFQKDGVDLQKKTHYIPCKSTSLAYDKYENQYIIGISGRNSSFAVLNENFQLLKIIGRKNLEDVVENSFGEWAMQGVSTDHSNIYALFNCSTSRTVNGESVDYYKNVISVYKKDTGEYFRDINLNIDISETTIKYEAEHLFRIGDRIIVAFNAIGSKSFRYYDIAPSSAFKIEYFDNMDVEDDDVKTFDDSQLKQDDTNLVIYGASAELKQNSFCKEGWRFKGWALYRPDINSWFCADESGNKAWSQEVPDNGSKVIYEDKQRVMAICPKGKKIILVAQWKQANYFYVTYYFDDYDKEDSITKNYVHANTITLLKKPFTNPRGSDFLGWYAHWVENDEWYCSTSSGVKGWYKENEIPSGYTKHLFGDEASISQITGSGQNIEMFGVWNEYTIFYHPGEAAVSFAMLLESQKGAKGISSYNTTNVLSSYGDDETGEVTTMSTWYHYWLDGDQWYYASADGATRSWYADNAIPSGYSRYINNRGYTKNSVPQGNSLVLCWANPRADCGVTSNATFDF